MITDPRRLRKVLEAMNDTATVDDLVVRASSIMEAIKKLPPNVDIEEIRKELRELVSANVGWLHDGDIEARRALNRIAQRLNRLRRIKRGGVAAFPAEIRQPLAELLALLGKCGVFLVPVGELEEWLADQNIAESKENKWAWANAASLRVQALGACQGDIWDFIRSVGKFLSLTN